MPPSQEDQAVLAKEANEISPFDPLQLRKGMWQQLALGDAVLKAKKCSLAKVLWIQPKGSGLEPPWELWGRLFQWIGRPEKGGSWRIFWLPSEVQRLYPKSADEPLGPAHLNGGYCYPCRSDTVVVYRKEEATRVLVHELLHGACLDPYEESVPVREACIETWAELFLIVLCSGGDAQKAETLWRHQSQWIANQNAIARQRFHATGPQDYAWRYTVGREIYLERLHITLPKSKNLRESSSRMTSPLVCP